jgi:hypothetical protein
LFFAIGTGFVPRLAKRDDQLPSRLEVLPAAHEHLHRFQTIGDF